MMGFRGTGACGVLAKSYVLDTGNGALGRAMRTDGIYWLCGGGGDLKKRASHRVAVRYKYVQSEVRCQGLLTTVLGKARVGRTFGRRRRGRPNVIWVLAVMPI
jgi:hypothetical protein